jgi:hypothetical protein
MHDLNLVALHQFLDSHYDDEDLRTLCFALGYEYDNLPAEGKANKMRELIRYLNHRGRLNELLAYVQETRSQFSLAAIRQERPETNRDRSKTSAGIEALNPVIRSLQESLKQDRVVIFWGGDLDSRLTGLPSRQQIADALARQEGLAEGQSLPAVAQQVMRQGNRFGFTNFIHEILDSTGKRPQPIHHTLVGLVRENNLETIITTAYDNMIDLAFREAGIPLSVVVNDSDLRFSSSGASTLIKLCGDRQQPASLVVTEQDENLLLRGRFREKADMIDEVRRAFRRQAVLFVGYRLRGRTVTALFDEVTGDRFQLPAFAIDPELSESERSAWLSNRGLTVIDHDPADFLHALLLFG